MAIYKEWECKTHGYFDSTHPLCPAFGCDSSQVERVFLTAPGVKSQLTKNIDASTRKTAANYGMTDIRTPREGESSMPKPVGESVLWGDEATKFMGKPLTQAHVPQSFDIKTKDGVKRWTDLGGMPTAATDLGITQKVLPTAAETTISSQEKQMRAKVKGSV